MATYLAWPPTLNPHKQQAELFFPAEFADDFPVSLQVSAKYGLIYVVTKLGLLFVYDLETATAVYRNRISPDPIFIAAVSESTGGFYAITRRGQVVLGTVNEATIVPFVSQQVRDVCPLASNFPPKQTTSLGLCLDWSHCAFALHLQVKDYNSNGKY